MRKNCVAQYFGRCTGDEKSKYIEDKSHFWSKENEICERDFNGLAAFTGIAEVQFRYFFDVFLFWKIASG